MQRSTLELERKIATGEYRVDEGALVSALLARPAVRKMLASSLASHDGYPMISASRARSRSTARLRRPL